MTHPTTFQELGEKLSSELETTVGEYNDQSSDPVAVAIVAMPRSVLNDIVYGQKPSGEIYRSANVDPAIQSVMYSVAKAMTDGDQLESTEPEGHA